MALLKTSDLSFEVSYFSKIFAKSNADKKEQIINASLANIPPQFNERHMFSHKRNQHFLDLGFTTTEHYSYRIKGK